MLKTGVEFVLVVVNVDCKKYSQAGAKCFLFAVDLPMLLSTIYTNIYNEIGAFNREDHPSILRHAQSRFVCPQAIPVEMLNVLTVERSKH